MEEINKDQYKTNPDHAEIQTPQLTQSQVVFYGNDIEDEKLRHTYWLRNKQLKGITSTLILYAFPDMYKGISKETLQNAADRGNNVHDNVQAYALWGGEPNSDEERSYQKIARQYGLSVIETEYLVSDNKKYASAIDMVCMNKDNEVILVDIKTTSQRHYDAVSLQLSIYAEWFERMNPGIKVSGLWLLWLRGEEGRFEEVPRVGSTTLTSLIRAYEKGKEDYHYSNDPRWLSLRTKKMSALMDKIEALTAQLDELKAETLQQMKDEHWYSLKSNDVTISMVAAKESERFNSTKYKKEHPEEYAQYITKTKTKEYITVKKSEKK